MDPNKKTFSKYGNILVSVLALRIRMESINRKTEMNELRILKVESRMEIGSPQSTDHKNKTETLEGKKKTLFFNCLIRVSYIRTMLITCAVCFIF